MYKTADGIFVYSPSDLTLYMRSPFASWVSRLEVDYPEKLAGFEKDQDALMGLLAGKGVAHEARYLKQLREKYGDENVIEIKSDRKTAEADTLDAMRSGYQVIFQAYLKRENFAGFADFLIRREGESSLGDYYYEAWDTKLSKVTKPYFVTQLCCYSWMLEDIQGRLPESVVVVLGNEEPETFRTAQYYSYYLNLKHQFLLAQDNFTGEIQDVPDPALYSDYGPWESYAKQLLKESDSLALVANIRKTQISKLREAGIQTSVELAQTKIQQVKGISSQVFFRLRLQAELQLQSRGQDKPRYKVILQDEGKGLSALPPSAELDVFFDIEGHPLEKGGLEYLWGVSYRDPSAVQGKQYAFKDWWAHDQEQEKLAFEGFIDWVYDRWMRDPAMHVYHYASYEITAINKISSREQTRKDETAALLIAGVFVDLYKIVRNGLLVGEPKYSIKNIEHLYREKRTTDVANGGESVVVYENWREQNGVQCWAQQDNGYKNWRANPDSFDWEGWPILKNIRDYNIDDCESTLELHDWLGRRQKEANFVYSPKVEDDLDAEEKTERQLSNEEKRNALAERQQRLIDRFEAEDNLKQDHQAKLLVSLLHFYDRERKPQYRSYFERLEKNEEDLWDDDTVVHDIKLVSMLPEEDKLICKALYNADQLIRTDKFKSGSIKRSSNKSISAKVINIKFAEISAHQGEVTFVIDADKEEFLQQKSLALFGDDSRIPTEALENRLCEITEQYFNNGVLSGAVKTLLNQDKPNFKYSATPLPVNRTIFPDNVNYQDAIFKSVQEMDSTCLCIQGPPGSGKTTTAKLVIGKLVEQGNRIGVMSNSHAAIMNVLEKLVETFSGLKVVKVGGYGTKAEFEESYPEDKYHLTYRKDMGFTQKEPYEMFQVVGATAYAFAKDIAHEVPLDYLFVDEASQVALASLIAVSGAAKNIILMGDQMQLEQPIQGSHPGDSGLSALEFMLKGHAVIPEEKGIFLERTYRMHPEVCEPLSEIVYEGKLKADLANGNQVITVKQPKLVTRGRGILSIKAQHEGNVQSSEEEVILVQQLIDELKTATFTNKDGQQRNILDEDILIVAPYNMQVNLLKEKLRGNLKIGTIDKFQGQEAPVVIVSMAVSDSVDNPRGLDFIFDINRLNVAISRAQALAVIVSNKGLEECNVTTMEQMGKVGLFCRLIMDS